jgi:hypothetical protein
MTTDAPNDPPEPTAAVDPLDERLSAALDGASDPDSEPSEVAEPSDDEHASARSRALEAARDLLAIPPPPLDDLTRRRLVRTAVAERQAPKRRSGQWLARVSGSAALVALVVLAGWALVGLAHNSGTSSGGSKAASRATNAPVAAPLDLHEVSDPAVLRQRVEAVLRGVSPKTALPQLEPTPSTGAGESTRAARCLSAVRVPAGATPGVLATATFHGTPALVVVAHDGSGTLIFVLASTDCRPLSYQFLRG